MVRRKSDFSAQNPSDSPAGPKDETRELSLKHDIRNQRAGFGEMLFDWPLLGDCNFGIHLRGQQPDVCPNLREEVLSCFLGNSISR